MYMETQYCIKTENANDIKRIAELWGSQNEPNACSLEEFDTEIFEVMAKTIKTVHSMEISGEKIPFHIYGKCGTDYDCTVFQIEYDGGEPQIKASQGDPDENEARFYTFMEAEYDEIPTLLKRNKNRTFKKAIKDDIPLGGFLNISYDEWYNSVLED